MMKKSHFLALLSCALLNLMCNVGIQGQCHGDQSTPEAAVTGSITSLVSEQRIGACFYLNPLDDESPKMCRKITTDRQRAEREAKIFSGGWEILSVNYYNDSLNFYVDSTVIKRAEVVVDFFNMERLVAFRTIEIDNIWFIDGQETRRRGDNSE